MKRSRRMLIIDAFLGGWLGGIMIEHFLRVKPDWLYLVAAIVCVVVVAHQWWEAKEHQRPHADVTEAAIIIRAMLDGDRPVVTKAPHGMTIAEAQAEVDRIWAELQFQPKPGAGGRQN